MLIAWPVVRSCENKHRTLRHEQQPFAEWLLGKWTDGEISITFEKDGAVMQKGNDLIELTCETDEQSGIATLSMAGATEIVKAKMGQDESLRLQSSADLGHLKILHRMK